jgi:hydroxymethylglutaryl-CoA lyase
MVKIVECPRDAWQGLPGSIPAEIKADYLRVLVAAGFQHIDAVSFVSKVAVPQMADSELERAVKTGAVSTLGFPYSISAEFLKRNQNQTPEEALEALEAIGTIGYKAGADVVAYVSMAFGNPYGEAWDIEEVVAACDLLVDCGVTQISLADTVGKATPKLVADVVADVMAVHDAIEIGVHLHGSADAAEGLIRAVYGAGCRRFDGAIGGLGGCPFAQDALVGNLPTEVMVRVLAELGAELPKLNPLDGLIAASAEIAKRYGTPLQ